MPFEKLDNGARLISPGSAVSARQFCSGGNFVVEWVKAQSGPRSVTSAHEILIVVHGVEGRMSGPYGARTLPPGTVAIVPAGTHVVEVDGKGYAVVLATDRTDLSDDEALNAADRPSTLIAPLGPPFRRSRPLLEPIITLIVDIPPPADNARMRFVQSQTMSINLVDYHGPRDRSALSPHEHADIEQGTLALEGSYVHHLREAWGRDAGQWTEDVHLPAEPPSVVLIPPRVIHTTEGVGEGRHVLLDIFAPPRADFRLKGWIWNAGDYAAEAAADIPREI